MMSPPRSARSNQVAQARIVTVAVSAARHAWQTMGDDFDTSWRAIQRPLHATVTAAQHAAAAQGASYVGQVLVEQGMEVEPLGRVRPEAFAGTASDGRTLDGLLRGSVVNAKQAVASGATVDEALARGGRWLDMAVLTQVVDAGRAATGAGITARPRTGWVRMVGDSACDRCVVLAGKFFRWNRGFDRHPGCLCTHIPSQESVAGDLRTDPAAFFDSLSVEEQNRRFTKAGAQAIRDGADIGQVVNARRGMTAAGATTEGTTRRGFAGRRMGASGDRQRLMPETIYQVAGSREQAVSLLRTHGYIV